jgi:hypothetical protein
VNQAIFTLTVPIESWAAERYVPAVATEAVALGDRLRDGTTTVEEVSGHSGSSQTAPAGFDVSAALRWRTGPRSLSTSVQLTITARDGRGQPLADTTVRTTTTWHSSDDLDIAPATGETFALAFGALEPVQRAAQAAETAFALLGVEVLVSVGASLAANRHAVLDLSHQPPMSSDAASPLNPYALAGIPGVDAEKWANAGFPAIEAERWYDLGAQPADVERWLGAGFTLDAAQAAVEKEIYFDDLVLLAEAIRPDEFAGWIGLIDAADDTIEVGDVLAFIDDGLTIEEVLELDDQGVFAYEVATMVGIVPPEEMAEWIWAIEERDLLDVRDVQTLVKAGLSPGDVLNAPEDLTALEIVRHRSS